MSLLVCQNKRHRSSSRTLGRPSSMTSFLVLRLSLMASKHISFREPVGCFQPTKRSTSLPLTQLLPVQVPAVFTMMKSCGSPKSTKSTYTPLNMEPITWGAPRQDMRSLRRSSCDSLNSSISSIFLDLDLRQARRHFSIFIMTLAGLSPVSKILTSNMFNSTSDLLKPHPTTNNEKLLQ